MYSNRDEIVKSTPATCDPLSNIDGVMNGKDDAISIFPEEIWNVIFKNLADGKDLLNCSRVCLLFHKQLHSSKTTFLFDKVFPLIFRNLSGADVLKCRGISRKWNAVVDKFLEQHASLGATSDDDDDGNSDFQHIPGVNTDPMLSKGLGLRYLFLFDMKMIGDAMSISHPSFRSMMGGSSRNPFIGRSVVTQIYDGEQEEGWEDYFNELQQFCEEFGRHIWDLGLQFTGPAHHGNDNRDPRVDRLNEFLQANLLQFLPNLKRLHLTGSLKGFPLPGLGSLPICPYLKTLILSDPDVSMMGLHPFPVALLGQYREQLRRISLDMDYVKGRMIQLLEWPSLVELHVVGRRIDDKEDFDNLCRLRIPKLKALKIQEDSPFRFKISFERLLDLVWQLSATTRLDTLDIQGKIHYKRGSSLAVQGSPDELKQFMPKSLKAFNTIHFPRRSLTFLIRCPFIENLNLLSVENTDEENEEDDVGRIAEENHLFNYLMWERERQKQNGKLEERDEDEPRLVLDNGWTSGNDNGKKYIVQNCVEIVQVNQYILKREMYKSNIWELMPGLKVLTCGTRRYTRERYSSESKTNFVLDPQIPSINNN